MKLSCSQMEILLSFYLENEISPALKKQVEAHLNECEACSEKYKFFRELFSDIKNSSNNLGSGHLSSDFTCVHGNDFSAKISAYIDNELTSDENLKVKKLAITNSIARRELEDSYNIRRLMSDSFKKSKSDAREDYVKTILRQLELEDEINANFHPAIRFLVIFALVVLVLSSIVLISLNV